MLLQLARTLGKGVALAFWPLFGKGRRVFGLFCPRLPLSAAQILPQFCSKPILSGFGWTLGRHVISLPRSTIKRKVVLDITSGRDNRPRLFEGPNPERCCSSVVERTLGKGEVGSSILPSSTICISADGA